MKIGVFVANQLFLTFLHSKLKKKWMINVIYWWKTIQVINFSWNYACTIETWYKPEHIQYGWKGGFFVKGEVCACAKKIKKTE